jgi:hypothetical protein
MKVEECLSDDKREGSRRRGRKDTPQQPTFKYASHEVPPKGAGRDGLGGNGRSKATKQRRRLRSRIGVADMDSMESFGCMCSNTRTVRYVVGIILYLFCTLRTHSLA